MAVPTLAVIGTTTNAGVSAVRATGTTYAAGVRFIAVLGTYGVGSTATHATDSMSGGGLTWTKIQGAASYVTSASRSSTLSVWISSPLTTSTATFNVTGTAQTGAPYSAIALWSVTGAATTTPVGNVMAWSTTVPNAYDGTNRIFGGKLPAPAGTAANSLSFYAGMFTNASIAPNSTSNYNFTPSSQSNVSLNVGGAGTGFLKTESHGTYRQNSQWYNSGTPSNATTGMSEVAFELSSVDVTPNAVSVQSSITDTAGASYGGSSVTITATGANSAKQLLVSTISRLSSAQAASPNTAFTVTDDSGKGLTWTRISTSPATQSDSFGYYPVSAVYLSSPVTSGTLPNTVNVTVTGVTNVSATLHTLDSPSGYASLRTVTGAGAAGSGVAFLPSLGTASATNSVSLQVASFSTGGSLSVTASATPGSALNSNGTTYFQGNNGGTGFLYTWDAPPTPYQPSQTYSNSPAGTIYWSGMAVDVSPAVLTQQALAAESSNVADNATSLQDDTNLVLRVANSGASTGASFTIPANTLKAGNTLALVVHQSLSSVGTPGTPSVSGGITAYGVTWTQAFTVASSSSQIRTTVYYSSPIPAGSAITNSTVNAVTNTGSINGTIVQCFELFNVNPANPFGQIVNQFIPPQSAFYWYGATFPQPLFPRSRALLSEAYLNGVATDVYDVEDPYVFLDERTIGSGNLTAVAMWTKMTTDATPDMLDESARTMWSNNVAIELVQATVTPQSLPETTNIAESNQTIQTASPAVLTGEVMGPYDNVGTAASGTRPTFTLASSSVGNAYNSGGGATTINWTTNVTLAVGDRLIVFVARSGTGAETYTVANSGISGLTWTPLSTNTSVNGAAWISSPMTVAQASGVIAVSTTGSLAGTSNNTMLGQLIKVTGLSGTLTATYTTGYNYYTGSTYAYDYAYGPAQSLAGSSSFHATLLWGAAYNSGYVMAPNVTPTYSGGQYINGYAGTSGGVAWAAYNTYQQNIQWTYGNGVGSGYWVNMDFEVGTPLPQPILTSEFPSTQDAIANIRTDAVAIYEPNESNVAATDSDPSVGQFIPTFANLTGEQALTNEVAYPTAKPASGLTFTFEYNATTYGSGSPSLYYFYPQATSIAAGERLLVVVGQGYVSTNSSWSISNSNAFATAGVGGVALTWTPLYTSSPNAGILAWISSPFGATFPAGTSGAAVVSSPTASTASYPFLGVMYKVAGMSTTTPQYTVGPTSYTGNASSVVTTNSPSYAAQGSSTFHILLAQATSTAYVNPTASATPTNDFSIGTGFSTYAWNLKIFQFGNATPNSVTWTGAAAGYNGQTFELVPAAYTALPAQGFPETEVVADQMTAAPATLIDTSNAGMQESTNLTETFAVPTQFIGSLPTLPAETSNATESNQTVIAANKVTPAPESNVAATDSAGSATPVSGVTLTSLANANSQSSTYIVGLSTVNTTDVVLVFVVQGGTSGLTPASFPIPTVTWGAGTFTQIATGSSAPNAGSANKRLTLFACTPTSSGTPTLTVNGTGGSVSDYSVQVMRAVNARTTGSFPQAVYSGGNLTGSPIATGNSLNTPQSNVSRRIIFASQTNSATMSTTGTWTTFQPYSGATFGITNWIGYESSGVAWTTTNPTFDSGGVSNVWFDYITVEMANAATVAAPTAVAIGGTVGVPTTFNASGFTTPSTTYNASLGTVAAGTTIVHMLTLKGNSVTPAISSMTLGNSSGVGVPMTLVGSVYNATLNTLMALYYYTPTADVVSPNNFITPVFTSSTPSFQTIFIPGGRIPTMPNTASVNTNGGAATTYPVTLNAAQDPNNSRLYVATAYAPYTNSTPVYDRPLNVIGTAYSNTGSNLYTAMYRDVAANFDQTPTVNPNSSGTSMMVLFFEVSPATEPANVGDSNMTYVPTFFANDTESANAADQSSLTVNLGASAPQQFNSTMPVKVVPLVTTTYASSSPNSGSYEYFTVTIPAGTPVPAGALIQVDSQGVNLTGNATGPEYISGNTAGVTFSNTPAAQTYTTYSAGNNPGTRYLINLSSAVSSTVDGFTLTIGTRYADYSSVQVSYVTGVNPTSPVVATNNISGATLPATQGGLTAISMPPYISSQDRVYLLSTTVANGAAYSPVDTNNTYFSNGNNESATNWTNNYNATITRNTVLPRAGSYATEVTATSSGYTNAADPALAGTTGTIGLLSGSLIQHGGSGTTYTYTTWMRAGAGVTSANWVPTAYVVNGGYTPIASFKGSTVVVTNTGWSMLSLTFTVPANSSAYPYFVVSLASTSPAVAGDKYYVDDTAVYLAYGTVSTLSHPSSPAVISRGSFKPGGAPSPSNVVSYQQLGTTSYTVNNSTMEYNAAITTESAIVGDSPLTYQLGAFQKTLAAEANVNATESQPVIDIPLTDATIGGNLLTVAQQDNETTAGWASAFGLSSAVRFSGTSHKGSYSTAITLNGSTAGALIAPANTVVATPNTLYTFSFWMQPGQSTASTWAATVYSYDASQTFLSAAGGTYQTLTLGVWTLFTVTFTTPANTAYLNLEAVTGTGVSGNVYYLDDAALYKGTRNPENAVATDSALTYSIAPLYKSLDTASNLLSGYDVDNEAAAGWSQNSGCTTAQSSAQAHGGTYSTAITMTAVSGGAIGTHGGFPVAVTPGTTYLLTVWMKASTSSASWGLAFYPRNNGSNVDTAVFGPLSTVTSGAWVQLTGTWTPTVNANQLIFGVVTSNAANGLVFYVDDASLTGPATQQSTVIDGIVVTPSTFVTQAPEQMTALDANTPVQQSFTMPGETTTASDSTQSYTIGLTPRFPAPESNVAATDSNATINPVNTAGNTRSDNANASDAIGYPLANVPVNDQAILNDYFIAAPAVQPAMGIEFNPVVDNIDVDQRRLKLPTETDAISVMDYLTATWYRLLADEVGTVISETELTLTDPQGRFIRNFVPTDLLSVADSVMRVMVNYTENTHARDVLSALNVDSDRNRDATNIAEDLLALLLTNPTGYNQAISILEGFMPLQISSPIPGNLSQRTHLMDAISYPSVVLGTVDRFNPNALLTDRGAVDENFLIYDASRGTSTTDEWWSINNISLSQQSWNITTIGGSRFGVPNMRGDDLQLAFRPGRIWVPKTPDSRVITLVMWMVAIDPNTGKPPTTDQKITWNDNWNFLRRLFFTPKKQLTLTRRWKLNRYSPRIDKATAKVQLGSTMEPQMTGRTRAEFSVDLVMADPYFYGAQVAETVLVSIVNVASPTLNIRKIIQPGDDTSGLINMTVTLYGPLKNPRLVNKSGAQGDLWFKLLTDSTSTNAVGTINAGEYVTVNVEMFKAVRNNGQIVTQAITHSGAIPWFALEPGENVVVLEGDAGSTGGYAVIRYSPPYL